MISHKILVYSIQLHFRPFSVELIFPDKHSTYITTTVISSK